MRIDHLDWKLHHAIFLFFSFWPKKILHHSIILYIGKTNTVKYLKTCVHIIWPWKQHFVWISCLECIVAEEDLLPRYCQMWLPFFWQGVYSIQCTDNINIWWLNLHVLYTISSAIHLATQLIPQIRFWGTGEQTLEILALMCKWCGIPFLTASHLWHMAVG